MKREEDIDWIKPHKLGTCIICTQDIIKKRITYIHFLWNDELYEGKPICDQCYFELYEKIDHKYLDYDCRQYRPDPTPQGIDQWL